MRLKRNCFISTRNPKWTWVARATSLCRPATSRTERLGRGFCLRLPEKVRVPSFVPSGWQSLCTGWQPVPPGGCAAATSEFGLNESMELAESSLARTEPPSQAEKKSCIFFMKSLAYSCWLKGRNGEDSLKLSSNSGTRRAFGHTLGGDEDDLVTSRDSGTPACPRCGGRAVCARESARPRSGSRASGPASGRVPPVASRWA